MDSISNANDSTETHQSSSSAIDKTFELADTVIAIVKEVGEMLNNFPYVKSLSGVILQIIGIRNEIKANEERCREIIDKVLRMSNSIYDKLAEVARSSHREKLSRLETHLRSHERTLRALYDVLEKNQSRSRFSKFIHRGLDELNRHDRLLDELNTQLILDIIFHITMEQAASVPITNALGPSTRPNHTLPPRPDLMVQREDQLNTALEILLSSEASRIAILGGGGFGKTTLARSIFHHSNIAERYKSRYFLACEDMADVDALLLGFATMLGIKDHPSAMLASARNLLATSTTLLCLDNFETPWEPSATRSKIDHLLASIADIPNLSLIITMRGTQRPSKVRWSHPLLSPLSTLSADGAREILQAINPNHIIDDFTQKLLDGIDGIPLAITLMSNLFRDGETSQSLWQRWSKTQTHVIQTGSDDRESNLNTSIALSVESHRMKRNPEATILLAVLSRLPSGFPSNEEALSKLEHHLQIRDIHSAVETLRTVSLIEASGSGRIQMLSPIRLFCLEFLPSEISVVLEQIVNYYINVMLDVGDRRDDPTSYNQVVPEIQNIHSVFQRVYKAGYSQDITRLIEATTYLTNWSRYVGYISNDTIQMALEISTDLPIQYAKCLLALGLLHNFKAQHSRAEKCFREAAQFCKQGGHTIGQADALLHLGDVLCVMQQVNQAEVDLKASLELFTQAGYEQGQANVANSLGNLYINECRYSEAEPSLMRALEVYKQMPTLLGQANTTEKLARLHLGRDNLVIAEYFATESLTSAKQANYGLGEANALFWLGRIHLRTDNLTGAKRVLERAFTIAKQLNSMIHQLLFSVDLAEVYIQSDQLSTAEALLTTYAQVNLDLIHIPMVLATLAQVYFCGDHLQKAESCSQTALVLFKKYNAIVGRDEALSQQGAIYLKSDRLDDAERVLNSIPHSGPSYYVEMHRLWVLGDLYMAREQLDAAETSFNSAMTHAKRCRYSYAQGSIIRSLGTLHVKRGRVNRAIRAFKRALELHRKAQWVSEQATDLKRLGEAYEVLGMAEEAETAFKEAEELMESIREARVLKL